MVIFMRFFIFLFKIFGFWYKEYKLDSITGDNDAQAQVVVILEKEGKRFMGRGQSTDIVETSINAYINGINRLYKK